MILELKNVKLINNVNDFSFNGDKKNRISLSTKEFAKDQDAKEHKEWFDFSDFQNPQKVVQSIIKGTPILKNLRILDAFNLCSNSAS